MNKAELNISVNNRIKDFISLEQAKISQLLYNKKVKFSNSELVEPVRKDKYGDWAHKSVSKTGKIIKINIYSDNDDPNYYICLRIKLENGDVHSRELKEVIFI